MRIGMDKVQKIRAEVEKRYRENKADGYSDVCEELWDILSFIDSMQEEPVSESINFEQELYKAFGQVKDFTLCMRIAKRFYDMGKKSREPVSDDLAKEIEKLSERYPEISFAKLSRIAVAVARWQQRHIPVSHDKSWRLKEQLWLKKCNLKDASYQYVYDASNDWMIEIPVWNDVQDAFKAGAEWKENIELTWEDLAIIKQLSDDFVKHNQTPMSDEEFYKEIVKRFKERKEK